MGACRFDLGDFSGLNSMFVFLIPGNQNEGIHYIWEGIQEFSHHEV